MDCKPTFTENRSAAESLVSAMFGLGLASMLFISLASIYLYSTRSFADLANYVDLDSNTRLALDLMSRDIRQADSLTTYSSNALTFQMGTNVLKYTRNSARRSLIRQLGSVETPILTDCDDVHYDIFQRNLTNGDYDVYATATPANCKVVQVTLVCSRSMLGTKANSATMQSAKIVIRKQQ